jgi:2-polyprenyl-3-methyl-5-hydroxy-6-metoxy-1,4-benzoquinol methylase
MNSKLSDDTPLTLEFTGERFVPELEGDDALEHLHRYLMARDLASGKVVLDIACGEGYGSAMLAAVASHVIGVDISKQAIEHARGKYTNKNLEFREGRADAIPLAQNSVDLVVSFETIEHHDMHTQMIAEIHHVLRPGGLLLISSPDKREYSDVPMYSNPFHVKELYLEELKTLLALQFQNVAILGQRVCFGSVIASDREEQTFSSFVEQDDCFMREGGIPRPHYFVAVASNAQLPVLGTSFYEQNIHNSHAVMAWANEVNTRDQKISERDQQLRHLRESLSWRITKPLRSIIGSFRRLFRNG